jgi:hypothetical protein
MKAPEKVFYFEAQGGLVRETLPSVSNFFQYELPDTPENRHFIEAGLKSARLEGSSACVRSVVYRRFESEVRSQGD